MQWLVMWTFPGHHTEAAFEEVLARLGPPLIMTKTQTSHDCLEAGNAHDEGQTPSQPEICCMRRRGGINWWPRMF